MGDAPTPVASPQGGPWGPRAKAHGAAPGHPGRGLSQHDGGPMAHDAPGYRPWPDTLWLLAPRAPDGGLGAAEGDAAPVGTAEPGPAPRAGRGRGGEPAPPDGDARRGRRFG